MGRGRGHYLENITLLEAQIANMPAKRGWRGCAGYEEGEEGASNGMEEGQQRAR